MTALTNQTEDDLLDLLFTNVDAPNWGDAAGLQNSAAAGTLGIGCYTGDALSDTSTSQATNEAAYTGYARQTVARSTAGWTVASGTVDNDAVIRFGSMSAGGPITITDVGIGSAATGAGYLFLWGQVTADLVVNNGVNPQYAAGALDISIN